MYLDAQEWQLDRIQAGLSDLDAGKKVSGQKVSEWLKTWGKRHERKSV
jgi:predicted transcriptional regulator